MDRRKMLASVGGILGAGNGLARGRAAISKNSTRSAVTGPALRQRGLGLVPVAQPHEQQGRRQAQHGEGGASPVE